jgi:hypothetical protein
MWPLRCAGLRRSAESLSRAPGFFPPGDTPYLEQALKRDPFGNQFCIVKWPFATPAAVESEQSVAADR